MWPPLARVGRYHSSPPRSSRRPSRLSAATNIRGESMQDRRRYIEIRAFAAAAVLAFCEGTANAQWKPTSQVEIVIPNAPGGGNDAVGRLMQRIWQERK